MVLNKDEKNYQTYNSLGSYRPFNFVVFWLRHD